MARIPTFSYKFPGQRKTRTWVVYPDNGSGKVTIQADGCIGEFDPATGEGRLSLKGEYFLDLSMRGKPYTFPKEVIDLATATRDHQEATMGNGDGSITILGR